jgi:CRISPR-associated protein Csx17
LTDHKHRLAGCRPEPLGSYLKALGVLRLVAEQADPTALGRWDTDGFVLVSALDDDALQRFFLEQYQPTPLVSPWNNSSGFGPEGAGELHTIEQSTDVRLAPYREAIRAVRGLLAESAASGWSKEQVLRACRARLPDACVGWMDAAAVLTDGRIIYPPVLGTGGNDGRLEFSRNFHQRVLNVLGLTTPSGRARALWLGDALFDLGRSAGMRGRSPGQFDPGAAGGANSAPAGAADSVLNPWDWVLLLEGSLVLASGSARRLGAGVTGRAAAAFTVDASAGGYASASAAESSRGELWAPLWTRPAGLGEVRRLFAEGRADWQGGHARSGLDLAKAAASLGVDRGIDAFSRHAFVERFGLSTVAVPVGRIAVRERTAVAPLAQLDPWLNRVRQGGNPPAGVAAALRLVDRVSFELAAQGGGERLLAVLVATADLERAVGQASSFRERTGIGPVAGLDAERWVEALDPGDLGPEFRLAVCLASGRDAATEPMGALRRLLRPIEADSRGRPDWSRRPAPVSGFGSRPVHSVLAAAHARRVVELVQARRRDEDGDGGLLTSLAAGSTADPADVADLVAGRVDAVMLEEALAACLLLDWPIRARPMRGGPRRRDNAPPAWSVLGPFFTPERTGSSPEVGPWRARLAAVPLRPEPAWPALLAADRTSEVLDRALCRLRIAELQPVPADGRRMSSGSGEGQGPWLAAAGLCRLSWSARTTLLERACPDPDLSYRPMEASVSTADEPEGDPSA